MAPVFTPLLLHHSRSYNNPDHPVQKEEPWRPVALLRTIFGHVTSVRNASAGLPDGLSAVNWVAHGMPRLSVFVPVYKVRLLGWAASC